MDQRATIQNGNRGAVSAAAEVRTPQNHLQEEEIDLREIVSLLVHHAWIFALAALAGALLVGLGVKIFVPAKYTAKSTIYVFSTATEASTQTINTADKMTKDFQIIATTTGTIQMVIDKLGLDMTVAELKSQNSISVTNPEDSHMLRISVTNRDPAAATEISNALADVMCEQIAYIMKSERPQFVETAVMGSKTSPYVRRDALIGGMGFAMIAVIFVLVRYFVNDAITTEEDVNRYLGLTILSSVPLERTMSKQ